jgi:outer membrane protein assembly factor BamA/autotransporter translocation and assembly factor TamB
MDVEWTSPRITDIQISVENQSVASRRAPSVLPIEGGATLQVKNGHWQLQHDHQVGRAAQIAGTLSGQLSSEAIGRSSVGGRVEVAVMELHRLMASLRAARMELPAWTEDLRGHAQATLEINGVLESPRTRGMGAVGQLRWTDLGPVEATFNLSADSQSLAIDDLNAAMAANRVSGSVSTGFQSGALAGMLRLDLQDPAQLFPAANDPWKPSGKLTADVQIEGGISSPALTGTFEGEGVTVASQQLGMLSGRIEYADGRASVSATEVRQPNGGGLSLAGSFVPSTREYSITLRGRDLALTPVGEAGAILPVDASLSSLDFSGQGTLDHPRGQGQLTFSRIAWRDLMLGSGDVNIELSDAGVQVDSRLPNLNTRVGGTVQVSAPWAFDLAADVIEADLSNLAGRGLIAPNPTLSDLNGNVSLAATATGDFERLRDSRVDVTVHALTIRKEMSSLQLTRAARLQYQQSRMTAEGVELRTGDTMISLAGGLGESLPGLQLKLAGELRDLTSWLAAFGVADRVSIEGRVNSEVLASGSIERPILTGSLSLGGATVQVRDVPPLESASLTAQLSDGVINLPAIGGLWQGASVNGRARLPLRLFEQWLPSAVVGQQSTSGEVGELALRVDDLTPVALGAFMTTAPERLQGSAAASLELRAETLDLERLEGSLTVERLNGNVAGVTLTQAVPTRFEIGGGRIRVDDWVWDASGSRLEVTGEASLTTRVLDIALIGMVDLRMVGGFVPGTTTGGEAEIGLQMRGPVATPEIYGTVVVREGELQSIDPQVALDAVDGRVLLDGTGVRLADFTGSANGGPFTLSGELRREGFALVAGTVDFSGQQIALNVPRGFRTEVDAVLTLSFETETPQLTGRATIQRGAYREPFSLAAGLVGAARRRPVPLGRSEPSWVDQLGLNVAISSAEDLIVDNNYGRMDLALDVRLVGSVGKPAIVGRAEVREGGVLYLGGRAYQVESGVIDFVDQNEIRPDLNITARTRVSGTDITLTISGTPDTLKGELTSSSPEFSQSDLVSLLLTGRPSSDIGGAETAIAQEQLIGLLSGEVLGFAAQAVGLDTIRLERGAGVEELRSDPSLVAEEADPSSRLTLSKNFSRYAEVVLSQDLRESGNFTWIFGVTPRRGMEVRTVYRDDHSRSYEIRHDISFGRPGGSPAPTRSTRPPDRDERVADVRFTGETGVPVRELDAVLKLRAGERFDFYQWQSDRERVRRIYLDRGYFEARITTRRRTADQTAAKSGTILEYTIRPGPHTTLTLEGYPLPERVRRDLEVLWSNAVFEQILLTDMERRVRVFLIEEGYLAAKITVARGEAAGNAEKSIRVSVTSGVRTRSRAIVFSGNEIISTSRLDTLIRERDLEIDAWVEPALLVRAIQNLYEEEGMLAAVVGVGEPEIAPDRAILPVRISEGSPFTVGVVVIAGTNRLPESEVRDAFALQPGQAYLWREVEAGRRAVEAAYRRQGFNAVRTEVQEEIDGTRSEVRVTLQVDEGAQQVLQQVELEGAEGMRRESLSRALALETGQAADLSSWQQGRRRLLETGLFRRVDIQAVPMESPEPAVADIQPVAAHITLDRWPLWRLRYGFEIADELAPLGDSRVFGPGFTADLQRRTIWGLPVNVGTSFRLTRDDRIGRIFLSAPNFFTLPLSTTMYLSRSREDINESGFLAFVSDKTTVTAEQRYRRSRFVQFSYGYQYERNHTFDPNANPDDPLALDLTVTEARLTSTGLVDRRDDPFDATRGGMHSSTFEYGPKALGSDVRFMKYFGQQFYFRPLGTHLVSASAFRFGVGRGLDDQDLIPSERFYAGGANTVRGYREDSLGGVDFLGIPLGGHALMIFNQEARFPIYKWLRGVGFFDAGNVFAKASDLSFDLKASLGLGLRLATPVGMFRVDLGVPLSSQEGDNGRREPRWYFSLGQMF